MPPPGLWLMVVFAPCSFRTNVCFSVLGHFGHLALSSKIRPFHADKSKASPAEWRTMHSTGIFKYSQGMFLQDPCGAQVSWAKKQSANGNGAAGPWLPSLVAWGQKTVNKKTHKHNLRGIAPAFSEISWILLMRFPFSPFRKATYKQIWPPPHSRDNREKLFMFIDISPPRVAAHYRLLRGSQNESEKDPERVSLGLQPAPRI